MSEETTKADTKIILYRTSWCAFCHTEAQWLERLGIQFTVKDIEADQSAHDELMEKIGGNFKGVPVTDVAGDIILGFDRPRLQESIKNHGITPTSATA